MPQQFNNSLVCHHELVLGSVSGVSYDFPNFYGAFTPNANAEGYRDLFAFLMDEDASGEPPFSADLLDEDGWSLEVENGDRVPISLPAIDFDERTIDWRLRS